ncbi:MAG: thioredoxin family protein [Synergistaceae bacterium]|jgi:glutaredoxin|nr:thioredoxin family protein [Synergistaceae bacterium]
MLRYLTFFSLFILILQGTAHAAPFGSHVFSADYGRVNLSRTFDFETYTATGSEEHRQALDDRLNSHKIADFFEEGAKKIDYSVTLLMIGMMYCPDCKIVSPYLEALSEFNPYIRTRYLVRNDTQGAREFMTAHTGRTNMPSVFVIRPDGSVADGAYVETPARVTAMLASAATDDERNAIWDDFHNGDYDEDVQSDLLKLVLSASKKQSPLKK